MFPRRVGEDFCDVIFNHEELLRFSCMNSIAHEGTFYMCMCKYLKNVSLTKICDRTLHVARRPHMRFFFSLSNYFVCQNDRTISDRSIAQPYEALKRKKNGTVILHDISRTINEYDVTVGSLATASPTPPAGGAPGSQLHWAVGWSHGRGPVREVETELGM